MVKFFNQLDDPVDVVPVINFSKLGVRGWHSLPVVLLMVPSYRIVPPVLPFSLVLRAQLSPAAQSFKAVML